jgi:hypothetical protein
MPDLKQSRSDAAHHANRMRPERIRYSDAMAATRKSLIQSRKVLAEADAMLAKDHKVLIEQHHRKPRKPRNG